MRKKFFEKAIALLLIFTSVFSVIGQHNTNAASNPVYYQVDARKMIDTINSYRTSGNAWYWNEDNRTKHNCGKMAALKYDYNLEQIAMIRAAELATAYSHTRPNGEQYWQLEIGGVHSWAESVGSGLSNPSDQYISWLEEDLDYDGQIHRRFMLASEYTAVGIAHVVINGMDYYIQEFGYDYSGDKCGWQKSNNQWIYNDSTMHRVTGWQKIDGVWYYFNKTNGDMQTGWQFIGDEWYYFGTSGKMASNGWKFIDDEWYYFDASGHMARGWLKIDNIWYHFNGSGIMARGWAKISGVWYYFKGSGEMVTGWKEIDGKWYYFKSSGAMAANEWIDGKYHVNSSGVWDNK